MDPVWNGNNKINRGDKREFNEFVADFYASPTWKALRSTWRDPDAAQDAFGDVYESALNTVEAEGIENPWGYFRAALKARRYGRIKRRARPAVEEDAELLVADPRGDVIEQSERRQRESALHGYHSGLAPVWHEFGASRCTTLRGFCRTNPDFGAYENVKKARQAERVRYRALLTTLE